MESRSPVAAVPATLMCMVEALGGRTWRGIARDQAGLITRAQLASAGVERWSVAHRVATERWQRLTATVVATTTGSLTVEQRLWLGVLHAGAGAIVGGITAAEHAGLRNWHRDEAVILVPYDNDVPAPVAGLRFVRTRRDTDGLRARGATPPRVRIEPAVLMFAAAEPSARTAQGVLAAVVQQRLTEPGALREWLERLAPLRRPKMLRQALADIAGGAQSVAEIDVRRFCRRHRFALPARQVKRLDATGRLRYTDCEWQLPDGRTMVLEVDGAFHMDVEHWEHDMARERALTAPGRVVMRCTARELREDDGDLARDLARLGVPREL